MSSLASVAVDSIEETPAVSKTVTVFVDPDGHVSVDDQFVRVPDQGTARITWQLHPDLADVVFDNPGIRMLGPEQPNMAWQVQSNSEWTALWVNDQPSMSFSYRIHLVRITGNVFTPFSTDPIVRNDPPPAP